MQSSAEPGTSVIISHEQTQSFENQVCCFKHLYAVFLKVPFWVARWLSGRASDSGARRRVRNLPVSLSRTLNSPKVLVIASKRWLRPDMTEKLFTGTLSPSTNKQKQTPFQTQLLSLCYAAAGKSPIHRVKYCYYIHIYRTFGAEGSTTF